MAQPDLEDVIDQMSAILQSQFPASLAAVDARKATPLNPEAPAQWVFGDMEVLPIMPCVVVTGHQTKEITDEHGYRVQGYALEVEAYYVLDDVQNLSRIVRRYGAALDDTIRANQVVAGYWKNISNITQQYWSTMEQKVGGLFQAVNVSFDVTVVTD